MFAHSNYRSNAGVPSPHFYNSSVTITPAVIEDAINQFEELEPGTDEIEGEDNGVFGNEEGMDLHSDMDWPDEVEEVGDDQEEENDSDVE